MCWLLTAFLILYGVLSFLFGFFASCIYKLYLSWRVFLCRYLIYSCLPTLHTLLIYCNNSSHAHTHELMYRVGSCGFNIHSFWHTIPQVMLHSRSKDNTFASTDISVFLWPTHLHQRCHSNNVLMLQARELHRFMISDTLGTNDALNMEEAEGETFKHEGRIPSEHFKLERFLETEQRRERKTGRCAEKGTF